MRRARCVPETAALRHRPRAASVSSSPCVAKGAPRLRGCRLALRRARCVSGDAALRCALRPSVRCLASSTACCILEAVALCDEGGSLCYFVVSCTVRGSIDEIACPRAAFSGPGKFIPFLTWSFETAAVGSHGSSMLFRKNCQNACANERDSIDEGSKADEMPHPGGEGCVGETKRTKCRVGGTEASEGSRRRD